ncbi:methyltransferase family protein [candidate division KSB1 bacterium]
MKKLYIPPALIAYCIIVMTLLYFFAPKYNMIVYPLNLIGLGIAFAGFILMGKARDLFIKHKTTLKIDTSFHLLTEGVYSKTRNPMYLGMFILVVGFSIFSTNILALILPIMFLLLVRLIFITKEEGLIQDKFGEEYDEYKKQVRRWI